MLKYIAIGSIARVGKDLLANAIAYHLRLLNKNVEIVSLSSPIKLACASFIRESFHLDVYTNDTIEKNIFRPILLAYGAYKRQITNGRFFCEQFDKNITQIIENNYKNKNLDYVICPDLRYAEYENNDEVSFFKSKKALIINLHRYDKLGNAIPAANSDEQINCVKIGEAANLNLHWTTFDNPECGSQNFAKSLIPLILHFF